MKAFRVTTLMFGALALCSGAAHAEEILRVTVPFPFTVHGETLPSGRYDVRSADNDPGIVMIEGIGQTKAHAVVSTIPESTHGPADGKPALTFTRDGDQYRLATVWESSDYGRELLVR